jgi:pimeloyl-ACP methyl ester carboxylesterase
MKNLDIFTTNLLNDLKGLPSDSHLPYIQSKLREIKDSKQRNIAEILIQIGIKIGYNSHQPSNVIVLIHGIRTFAEWFELIEKEIEACCDANVYFIKYGYLDAFRFWFPIGTRSSAINHAKRELRSIRDKHRTDDLVIVAHSFGSYIVSKILEEESDIDIKRLLLCGSIIRENYRWDLIPKLPDPILNDCGIRDNWPIAAKTLSWGYGSSGSFGLNSTFVTNRYFNLGHSGFFNKELIKSHWLPFILNNKIVPSPLHSSRSRPSLIRSLLSILPIQWMLLSLLIGLLLWKS